MNAHVWGLKVAMVMVIVLLIALFLGEYQMRLEVKQMKQQISQLQQTVLPKEPAAPMRWGKELW